MSEDKPINLFKAVKELNIGLGTAVDFLAQKGFKVDNKPNTKLSREMYDTLLKEYQGDKILKEQSNQINIGKIRKAEQDAQQAAPPAPRKHEQPAEEILIKNTGSSAPIKKEPAVPVVKDTTPASADVKDTSATATVQPETRVQETAVPQEASAPAEPATNGVKVVGKIDLSNFTRGGKRPKPEPAKQTPAPAAETAATVPAAKPPVTEPQQTTPAEPAQAAKPMAEVKTEPAQGEAAAPAMPEAQKATESQPKASGETNEPEAAPAVPQDDVIRARATELTGPKVVGKITLPVAPPKRGAANDPQNKRPRKRVPGAPAPFNREGNNNTTGQPGQNNQQQGGYRGGFNNGNRPGGGFNRNQGPNNRPNFRDRNAPAAPKGEPTEKEIQDQIKATLARLSGAGKSGKFAQSAKLRRQKRDAVAQTAEELAAAQEAESKVLKVTEFVTANELATLIDEPVTKIISTCMSLGMFVSINQRLDAETLTIVADEFGYEVQFIKPDEEEQVVQEEEDDEADLVPRAPVVTIMGHVDHGKTSLLDYIRKANVVAGEAGGITQHIGAYSVTTPQGQHVTFLDTPGHEAFTAMRARGSKVADIAIIVIAADDAVMPQTREAINHAQAANVPLVFGFTKVDKPGANSERIREQLAAMNLLVEDWGGKYQSQEISAKSGLNVDLLLEKVLLEAELLDLKANPNKRAVGTVIEAELDKGRGIVTTVLVQAGTLHVGDPILAGSYSGKVKALTNERGQKVTSAGPSIPVQVLGMQGAPTSGDRFNAMESESEARDVANKRMQLQREQGLRTQKHITLDEIGRRLAIGNFKELNVIIKGDVDGSIEALSDSLLKLSTEEIQVNVISKGVGQISESDVLLASASEAIIIGFQVRPSQGARKLAEQEEIDIRLYSIIYDAINEIKSAMEGMLAPNFEEKIVANVEIRQLFKISKVGTIAGCMVLDGKITRNSKIRIIRDGVVVHTGELASLRREKDDVKEVNAGYECGLNIQNFNNIEEGDIVEAYEQVEVKRKL